MMYHGHAASGQVAKSWLRLVFVASVLATGFAAAFDVVLLMTGWQHQQQKVAGLAQRVANASSREALLETLRAGRDPAQSPPSILPSDSLLVLFQSMNGGTDTLWQRGDTPGQLLRIDAKICASAGVYVVDMQASLPEWLFAAPILRAILPHGLHTRAMACAGAE